MYIAQTISRNMPNNHKLHLHPNPTKVLPLTKLKGQWSEREEGISFPLLFLHFSCVTIVINNPGTRGSSSNGIRGNCELFKSIIIQTVK